jgi:hypothetical protein
MKVTSIKQMKSLDPEDIRDAPGEKAREQKRKAIINKFLWWSRSQK